MKIDDKLVLKKLWKNRDVDSMVRDHFRDQMNEIRKPKKPSKHVGIEVECYTTLNSTKLQKLLFMFDLENTIQIGTDGSIRPERGHYGFELRILLVEKTLSKSLKKIGEFFKEAKLKTNNSCGLHVHLDMRSRNVMKCYDKLIKMQDVLYSLVKKNRWENTYCQYARPYNRYSKYQAVSMSPYRSKKTIEVRLHHGTTDVVVIEKWIRLLLTIVNRPEFKALPDNAKDITKIKGLPRDVKSYVAATVTDGWMLRKRKQKEADEALQRALSNSSSQFTQQQIIRRRPDGSL
jgi:hypothetical protein